MLCEFRITRGMLTSIPYQSKGFLVPLSLLQPAFPTIATYESEHPDYNCDIIRHSYQKHGS